MAAASRKTWALLWTLAIASMSVAALGLAVSYKATTRAAFYSAQCALLVEENTRLKERLEAVQVERHEVVISVVGDNGTSTLAQQNRNAGNVKSLVDGQLWEGQIGTDRFGHAIFKDVAYSVRATALIIKAYERKHGIKTVRALVTRFAEGNREQYIGHLCRVLGVQPDEEFSLISRLPDLLKGIAKFETGMNLGEEHLALVAAVVD